MTDNQAIKQARGRAARAFRARPATAQDTSIARARITDGCHCEIREGAWSLAADMPAAVGGTEKAPTPGVLGRAALASCYAIGIASLAASRDIRLDALTVDVQAASILSPGSIPFNMPATPGPPSARPGG